MFAEFGPAPLCLELDLDSYDGPWQHVSRFRKASGWLMVAKATIQSEHDILTARLVAACDERENPVPAFQARHLTECDWLHPTYCDELPPELLDELICEEEGELIRRWHREKNAGLAEAFEAQEQRIAELEGRVRSAIRRNDRRIAELHQRRRHPSATPDMRMALGEIARDLSEENDVLAEEMALTRDSIRKQAAEYEETLWAREDLLVEVEPLHLIRWIAKANRTPKSRAHFLGDRVSVAEQGTVSRVDLGTGDTNWKRRYVTARQLQTIPCTGDTVTKTCAQASQSLEASAAVSPVSEPVERAGDQLLDGRSRKLYGKLAKALAKAERLALVLQRSSPADPYLQYNQRQQAANAKEILLLEAEIARLPASATRDPTDAFGEDRGDRGAEEKFLDLRERRQLENERDQLLERWVDIAKARASAAEGSHQASLADTAFNGLRARIGEVEVRKGEIDQAEACERQQCAGHDAIQSQPAEASGWTDERVLELTRLWNAGVSAGNIASSLGGTTQNAIINKAARLGLRSTEPVTQSQQPETDSDIWHAPAQDAPPSTVRKALDALSAARERYYRLK